MKMRPGSACRKIIGWTESFAGYAGARLTAATGMSASGFPSRSADSPAQDQAGGSWLSHGGAGTSVMMQIPGAGPFVRALLPVRLAGGFTVTYGVWVGFNPQDLQRAFASGGSPSMRACGCGGCWRM